MEVEVERGEEGLMGEAKKARAFEGEAEARAWRRKAEDEVEDAIFLFSLSFSSGSSMSPFLERCGV